MGKGKRLTAVAIEEVLGERLVKWRIQAFYYLTDRARQDLEREAAAQDHDRPTDPDGYQVNRENFDIPHCVDEYREDPMQDEAFMAKVHAHAQQHAAQHFADNYASARLPGGTQLPNQSVQRYDMGDTVVTAVEYEEGSADDFYSENRCEN